MRRYNINFTASKDLRFGGFIVDKIAIVIFYFIALFFIVIFLKTATGSVNSHDSGFKFFCYLCYAIVYFLYYYILEHNTGRTFGKLMTGTRVVNNQGFEPTANEIVTRTLCRLIPFDAFSFFGDRGWHDSLSNTLVIKDTPPEITSSFHHDDEILEY